MNDHQSSHPSSAYQDLREAYKSLHLDPEVFEEFRTVCMRIMYEHNLQPDPENCEDFVVSFLEKHGGKIWPRNAARRGHLVQGDGLSYTRRTVPKIVTPGTLCEKTLVVSMSPGPDDGPPALTSKTEVAELCEELERVHLNHDALLESKLGLALARFYRAMLGYQRSASRVSKTQTLLAVIVGASSK
ncbi:hypothetical protein LTR56_007306 [Elasticomyces elasticus]|nr:hypothetical protein LTR56_007306 [Elasticomyces elasticus]KAK3662962.1 hypothetical protein LTR22_006126 [Elasticomyces elasticus]KAK4918920.1 hypothetical protein LTR49_013392 [Elasticomyces elasticus]KAK5753805.1 hypothetical protein LTS12_016114 [Elasticomyces elasticus]